MPLATQLFSPHGDWEKPWQQAEAKVTKVRRAGAAPTSWETSSRGKTWQCQALGLQDSGQAEG